MSTKPLIRAFRAERHISTGISFLEFRLSEYIYDVPLPTGQHREMGRGRSGKDMPVSDREGT